ncbi:MAG: hypothetical protein KDH96_09205 [Candidatus Riesia sp.]|nr:hypothetical protein [Candidatus Riesia sp.]
MNFFHLDINPELNAQYHCDKHVVKMILESAQILSTVVQLRNTTVPNTTLYKITHKNHPVVKWALAHEDNFKYLLLHAVALTREYTKRYSKIHKCVNILLPMQKYFGTSTTPNTWPPKCMYDQYKLTNDPTSVKSYRNYYIYGKRNIVTWKFTPKPSWYS